MISENTEAKSDFVAFLSLKENKKVNEQLIKPLVNKFFHSQDINDFKSLADNADISDEDFKSKNFKDFFTYFYKYIVNDIHKNNDEIEIPVTYCITFDKQNCEKKCEKTGVFYDVLFLYNEPVFYFIYIDIKEVFTCLRKQNN